jgi:hypothetical protein
VERDWLTSDSEVVGRFIQEHISSVSGVLKTQTLIPFRNRMKE